MSFPNYKYGTGLSNVGSYQASGKPFVETATAPASGSSATPVKISFPSVTKEITISCGSGTGEDVRVAFSALGVKDEVGSYFIVPAAIDGGAVTLDVKATELYAMSNGSGTRAVSVYAALTGISVDRVTNISPSGSNWSGSVGIG